MGMVLNDDIVPPVSNRAIARAMDIPHVPPVLEEVGVIDVADAPPIAGNLGGGVTAGLLQFDVIELEGSPGQTETATHDNIGDSLVGSTAWMHFLDSLLTEGTAEIVDPYAKAGVKH